MSLHRLNEIINRTAKALYDNEKFATGVLAVRARKLAESNPYDQTAIGMSNFLSKRASSNASFISRSELKDVYNKLYTSGNKFALAFGDELGTTAELLTPKIMQRSASDGADFVQESYERLADPILSNALNSAFDKSIPFKPYSSETAKSAERSCFHELNRNGLPPKKIQVVAGQPDALICQASYETPKGESQVLVPVEIREKRALLPTVFLAKEGFLDINPKDLELHILATAGKSFQVDVERLLQVVSGVKNGSPEPMNDVERAVMKLAAAKETPANHTVNGILYQEIDKIASEVELPEFEQPEEVKDFAAKLTSQSGQAEFLFSKSCVDMGRQLISQALKQFGYGRAQIGISGTNEDTVFYAVAVDSKGGFKVPVKITNKKPQSPEIILAAGSILPLTQESVSAVLAGQTDATMVAVASPMYSLKPSDLVTQVRQAMEQNNYVKAEDALNVLREQGDDKAFRVAYELYTAGLRGNLPKTTQSGCKMQYKSASSQHVICAHTNLPIHKVYQDVNGDCQPLYRKNMEESYEGASFLTSKIFLES